MKVITVLEQYYPATGEPVLDANGHPIRKENCKNDPDYIPPMLDTCGCPNALVNCLEGEINIPTTTVTTIPSPITTDATTTTEATTTEATTTVPPIDCSALDTITWDSTMICKPDGTTDVYLRVAGNVNNYLIQFFDPITGGFQDANEGQNTFKVNVISDGRLFSTHFRIKGCVETVEGFLQVCQA